MKFRLFIVGALVIGCVGATGCRRFFGLDGAGAGAAKHTWGNPRDTDVVVYLDASCRALKSDVVVGFSNHRVTFHLRGACATYDGQKLTLSWGTTSPSDNCANGSDEGCKGLITNGSADVTIHIKNQVPGTYPFSLSAEDTQGHRTSVDPDLEIDP